MTKVITYNNIQLSFQADTSGIKNSKSELAQLTREVNSHRTNLEKYMRKLEVIDQLEKKGGQSKQFLDDRLRAATKTYVEAEAKLGKYGEALLTVKNLVPAMTQEVVDLALAHKKQLLEAEAAAQSEKRRLAIAEQVRRFRKQDAQDEKEAAARRKEVADYVEQDINRQLRERAAIDARIAADQKLFQQSQRRLQIEDMIARISARQQGVTVPLGATKREVEGIFSSIAKHEAESTKNLQKMSGHLGQIASLENQIDQIKTAQLDNQQKQEQSLRRFRQSEQARAKAEIDALVKSAALRGQIANQAELTQIKENAIANVRRYRNLLQEADHQQILLNNHTAQFNKLAAARQAGSELLSGASMAGLPGGMLFGLSRAALGGFAIAGAAVGSLKVYSELRDNLVQLEVQFGSTAIAAEKFAQIRQLAAISPLETRDLLQAATALSQYGFTAEEIIPNLKRLSEISSGNAMRMEGLSRAFAQTKAAGKLMAQEVLQFVNSGFSPLAEMSRATGIEMSRLKKLMEEGKITFNDVSDSLISATQEGGRFFGQTDKMADELSAKFNGLKDSVRQLGEALGEQLTEPAKQGSDTMAFLFRAMAASARFSGSLIRESISDAINSTIERGSLIRFQSQLQGDLAAAAAQWHGLDFGPITEKNGKLFQNLMEENKRFDEDAIKAELEKNNKAAERIRNRLDGLNMERKLQEEINKATLTTIEAKKEEAKLRIQDFKKEAMQIAQMNIELDRLARNAKSAIGETVDREMEKAQQSIKSFEERMTKLPFIEEAKAIKEKLKQAVFKKDPELLIKQQAKQIGELVESNALTFGEGRRALAAIIKEARDNNREQLKELPRALEAGSVEAYQQIVKTEDLNRQQLQELKQQTKIDGEANKILREIANRPLIGAMN
jgi:tape measure domain-containing protein